MKKSWEMGHEKPDDKKFRSVVDQRCVADRRARIAVWGEDAEERGGVAFRAFALGMEKGGILVTPEEIERQWRDCHAMAREHIWPGESLWSAEERAGKPVLSEWVRGAQEARGYRDGDKGPEEAFMNSYTQ